MLTQKVEEFAPEFIPLKRLQKKYFFILNFSAILTLFFTTILMLPISLLADEIAIFTWSIIVMGGLTILVYIPIVIWIPYYYRSIRYEIKEKEIHVYQGVITRKRKVIPFRTITNIETKQGPFDRIYQIGHIELQTAGQSAATPGPEAQLEGIPDFNLVELQEYILNQVRRVTGTAGISHEIEDTTTEGVLGAILEELKVLRTHITNN